MNIDWKLCLVADTEAAGKRDILVIIKEAVEGGATLVQLRSKNLSAREFFEISLRASEFLKTKNIPLLINDRVDIALACQAAGVHLGQQDLSLDQARKILGKSNLVGISVNTVEEAIRAEQGGADYLGVGPIFSTLSKKDTRPVLSPKGLQAIREKVNIPILAIGGIDAKNAREVMESGASGIAVISAIVNAKNVRKATRELREAIG